MEENYYDIQAYMNSLYNELDTENMARLELISRATMGQGEYLYRKEAVHTDRLVEIQKMASKISADGNLHRSPKHLPPRYDLRNYRDDSKSKSKVDSPSSFFREAAFTDLPRLVQVAVKKEVKNAGEPNNVLISEDKSGNYKISDKSLDGRQILKNSLTFSKEDAAYPDMRSVYALATITQMKVSLFARLGELDVMRKASSLYFPKNNLKDGNPN